MMKFRSLNTPTQENINNNNNKLIETFKNTRTRKKIFVFALQQEEHTDEDMRYEKYRSQV